MLSFRFFMENGGPILWIILVMGIIGIGVFFERSLQLHRSRIDVTDFLQGIFNSISRGNIAEAKLLCDDTIGPVARLTSIAISHRQSKREVFENDLNEIASAEISRMERRLSIVSLIAHITPMLGILGTILGILALFIFVLFLEFLNIIQCGFTGIILGHRRNNAKIGFSVLYGAVAFFVSQVIVLMVIFIIAIFNKDFMNLFVTENIPDVQTIKSMIYVAISSYAFVSIISCFVNIRLFKKGVNID